MDLPLKLVDLVTLLFLSLLIVIIVFIILQRNIKRYRRRNDKESHFQSCKSIPKEIKCAIERKHLMSNSYKEPPDLLSESDLQYQDDRAKSFITRMKAFEVSKYLERALMECDYKRPMPIKFEDFIEELVENYKEDKVLPKGLLNNFVNEYVRAMHDPMAYTKEHLRTLNRLINRIIDHIAKNKKDKSNEIAKYKLDLDNDGDFDFNNFFRDKEEFLDILYKNHSSFNINNNNSIKVNKHKTDLSKSKETRQTITSNAAVSFVDPAEMFELADRLEESDIDLTDHFNKSNSKRKILSNNNVKSMKLFHKNKTAEIGILNINEPAAPIMNQPRTTKEKRSKSKYDEKKGIHLKDDSLENINLIDTKVDCSLANDSIKTQFDSENEEIPLVGTSTKKSSSYHKKKSSHSSITLLNQKIKNQSTPPLKTASSSNNQQSTLAIPATNTSSASNVFTTNLIDVMPRKGEENEGFNETNF